MNKLVAFFVFTFICGNIIGASSEGQQGVITATLSFAIDNDDTRIPVAALAGNPASDPLRGFLTQDILYIDGEAVSYTGRETECTEQFSGPCFTGAERGIGSTDASSHASGARVYNELTGVVNQMIGFNVAESLSTAGIIKTAITFPYAMTRAASKMVMWNYAFLEGPYYSLYKYILLYPISAGFVWSLWVVMSPMFMSIFRRL